MTYIWTPHTSAPATSARAYTLIWRVHFYAGLLCMPFVLWLSVTGALYLFKPQIDGWIDRPYDQLTISGRAAPASSQVEAALAQIEGGVLNAYEVPAGPNSAARILVGRGSELYRIYVHPQTLEVLKIVPESRRFTRLLFYLHGELMLGKPGSMLVELAASWAIVMLLTGSYLWWPRDGRTLAGVIYPRLSLRGRALWRDLHAVVGFWVSLFALFLLISGLPWAASWGGLLKAVRQIGVEAPVRQDWTTGSGSETAEREQQHKQHQPVHHGRGGGAEMSHALYRELDTLVPIVIPLNLAYPALISPPSAASPSWTARSEAQNRPLRENVVLDGVTGRVLSRTTFAQWPLIDRLVGYGVAIHEGQMFGWINQALGLFTAMGLALVSVSGFVMWRQRRPAGRLGAPTTSRRLNSVPLLVFALVVLGLLLPLLGASMIAILILDRWLLPHFPRLEAYLGKAR
jgi:uncharacterized iron-regulated membrane protein